MVNEQVNQILASNPVLKELADSLSDRINRLRSEKYKFDLQVLLNRDFHEGRQWEVIINDQLIEPRPDKGEVRLTANFIDKYCRIFVSEVTARKLDWDVQPVNADDARIADADIAKQILKDDFVRFQREQKVTQLEWYRTIDGMAYLAPEFRPDVGEIINTDPNTGKPIYKGRCEAEIKTFLDVLVPDGFPDMNKAPYMAVRVRKHKKEVQRQYNLPAEPPTDKDAVESLRWRNFYGENSKDHDDEVELFVVWFKKGNGALPNVQETQGIKCGIGFVWCDALQEILEVLPEFPYPFAEPSISTYPLIPFSFKHRTERFYCIGVPQELIGIQMEFNRTLSQIAQSKNFIGTPKWLAAKGSMSSIDDFDTSPGGVIWYNPLPNIPAPGPVTMPALNSYVEGFCDKLSAVANQITSVSDVAQAGQPGSVNSFSGIQKLSDIFAKLMTPMMKEWSESWSFFGKVWLMMKAKYTDTMEISRLTDDAADAGIKSWTGADISGDFDVRVSTDWGSQTDAERRQEERQDVQQRIMTPAEYRKRNYGIEKDSDIKRQRRLALDENAAMLAGQQVDNSGLTSLLGDDHAQHFDVHQILPPQVQMANAAHISIHWLGANQAQQLYQEKVLPQLVQLGIVAPPQPAMQPTGQPAQNPQPQSNPAQAQAAQRPVQ